MKTIPENKQEWPLIKGPVWQNCCNHKPEEYVCSFETCNREKLEQFDLYIHEQHGRESICIRASDEDSDYHSLSSLSQLFLLNSKPGDLWCRAKEILSEYGILSWNFNPRHITREEAFDLDNQSNNQ